MPPPAELTMEATQRPEPLFGPISKERIDSYNLTLASLAQGITLGSKPAVCQGPLPVDTRSLSAEGCTVQRQLVF